MASIFRRNNLIFNGLPAESGESQEKLFKKIRDIIKSRNHHSSQFKHYYILSRWAEPPAADLHPRGEPREHGPRHPRLQTSPRHLPVLQGQVRRPLQRQVGIYIWIDMHISTQVISKPIFPWQSGGQQALRVRGGGGEQEDTRRSPGAQDRVLQFYIKYHIRRKEVLTSTLTFVHKDLHWWSMVHLVIINILGNLGTTNMIDVALMW